MVESEGESEVAPEPVPEVVQEETPVEGGMIPVRSTVAPPPSRGARAPLSSVPHRAAALGVAAGGGMEVVLGHPTPYAPRGLGACHRRSASCTTKVRTLPTSADASSCGQACSRG
jgi:hypothetical protein